MRVRRHLEQLLHTHDTPQRTAAAFAVGIFFGFSPFLGLHTVLGLIAAFALNLNRVAVLLGIYANLPWILPAYYSLSTIMGATLLRMDVSAGALKDLTESLAEPSWGGLKAFAHGARPWLYAYLLGSTIGSVILALAAYKISLAMI